MADSEAQTPAPSSVETVDQPTVLTDEWPTNPKNWYRRAIAVQILLLLSLFMMVAIVFMTWWPSLQTQIATTILGVVTIGFLMASLSLAPPPRKLPLLVVRDPGAV